MTTIPSLNFPSNLQNFPPNKLPDLFTSSYFNKIPTPSDPSILGKRPNQALDYTLQDAIHKKIKLSQAHQALQVTQPLPPFLPQQNISFGLPEVNPQGFSRTDMEAWQQMQNFNALMKLKQMQQQQQQQQQQQLNIGVGKFDPSMLFNNDITLQNYGLNLKGLMEPKFQGVKEEFVKKEEYIRPKEKTISELTTVTPSKKYVSDHDTASEISEEREQGPQDEPQEPVLVEYTRGFPEWDLTTIFAFLRSGQSKESFEKEKEFRIQRKKRRAQKRLAATKQKQ